MKALIIANGTLPPAAVIRPLARTADIVICADGGANGARRLGIRPDIILGDLDSLSPSTRRFYRKVPLLRIEDQESTDLEKALQFAHERGHGEADVIGWSGDRIDHTTGALGCFKKFRGRVVLRLIDAVGTLRLVDRRLRLQTRRGERISLIPLEACSGVTTRNLRYALRREALELGVREGISNLATSGEVTVSVRSGTLLCLSFHRR